MTRLDAVLWQKFVDDGEVKCSGCDDFVDLSDVDTINEAVEAWNEHVRECNSAEEKN